MLKGTLTPKEFANKCIDFDFYDKDLILNTIDKYNESTDEFVISLEDKLKPEYVREQNKYVTTARYEYNSKTNECEVYLSKPICESEATKYILENIKDPIHIKLRMMIEELKFRIEEKRVDK